MEEDNKFRLKGNMIKEHQKLYNGLMIGIFILFIPIWLIYELFDFLGLIADHIGNTLSSVRMKIITFIFKIIYNKNERKK